jgi:predicted nucleic acid-binding protein
MRFWDSSALLPLVVRQAPFTGRCRRAFAHDVPRAIAVLARGECHSAIERLAREGALTPAIRRRSLRKIDRLIAAFDIVTFSPEVEAHALACLGRYALRSLDAPQRGCARGLALDGDFDKLPEFVCCDRRLAAAAVAAGFSLVIAP